MKPGRRGLTLLAVLVLALSACAVREQRSAEDWQEPREQWFAAHPEWSVSGRAAVREGNRGGSLAFDWQANGEQHDILLSTVVGGSQWRLRYGPGYAVLEGSEVGRIEGPHPDPLVEAAVGWPIPVERLSWWIRGMVPPGSREPWFDGDDLLRRIHHAPWTLHLHRYEQIGSAPLIPTRLEAESEPYRVRLALRDWQWTSHPETK